MISIASGCKVTTFSFPHLEKSVRSLLHICIKFLRFGEVVGKVLEEVVVEGEGDAFNEFGVERGLLEDIVHIGTFAGDLLGEPCGCAVLPLQFLFDKLTNVYHRVCH